MTTYLVLNLVFVAIVIVFLRFHRAHINKSRAIFITLAALLILTAVFDNLIVGLNIVDYHPEKILVFYIGVARVEDFFNAILDVIVVPAIWHRKKKKND